MKFTKFRAWLRRHPRHRILFWTTLIGLIVGVIEAAHPVEAVLQTVRNTVRSHPASGEIVMVAIDDRSISEVGQWPWPRSHHARLIRNLDALGAGKILLDIEFSSRSSPKEDEALGRALASLDTPAVVAVTQTEDPVTLAQNHLYPIAPIRAHAELASIYLRYNYQGFVWQLPYAVAHDGQAYPSLSVALSGRELPAGLTGSYPLDYSFDPKSFPRISAVDVLRGTVPREAIEGKRIIIGSASNQLGDIYFSPGHSRVPGAYLHIFGAETLLTGIPKTIPWTVPFAIAFLLVTLAALAGSTRATLLLFAGGVVAMLAVPLWLDGMLIFTVTAPALIMLVSAGIAISWTDFRENYRRRAATNAVSGMPNLAALRTDMGASARPLIAAKIRNYSEIVSTLSAEEERILAGQIAGRLSVTEADPTIYHGDEGVFAWFTDPGIAHVMDDYLDGLHTLFRSPVGLPGTQIDLAVTFGVETSWDRDAADRLKNALAAADEAADHGLRWKRYDPARLDEARWRLSLLSQLDAAIDAGDLWLAFQPKIELPSGRIIGSEALVRWTHPQKGEISPMEFILAAEQNGRIDRLTGYVLEHAISAAADLNSGGGRFGMAVNISARMISDPRLPGTIVQILDKHGFAPELLTLEVTETAALSSGDAAHGPLQTLRDMGVQISIDDYGTGLSTLEYIKRIPATEIKIDKSFVQAVTHSRSDRLMVNSTIQLAHSLGQKVVAEGIEDLETLTALISMGCDMAQGYYTGKPMRFQLLKKRVRAQEEEKAA